MTAKYVSQVVSTAGKAVATATSAPGCFIHDDVPIEQHAKISWGNVFSQPLSGNKVDFYVTGEEYFTAIADAITGAKKSIYIAGWQVNFDVELAGGKTLFQVLEKAIDSNSLLRVYVMPWLSPKVGVDTGDFETMLAVFQLNAGLPPPARAFAMPAIAQSDMAGGLGIGFSHHQKLVVIDEQRAFVGGIDLAYGRRDDGRFSLAANGRAGNELYSPCIPPVRELSKVEQTKYLTRAELLFASFNGKVSSAGTFLASAPMRPIASAQDAIKSASDTLTEKQKVISDWWSTVDLVPEFLRKLQDIPIDAAQDASRWAYQRLDQELQGKLERLRETGGAHVANAAAALLAWLNNASLEQLPSEVRSNSVELIEAFIITVLSQLSNRANTRNERYDGLLKLGKILPASGRTISSGQPRMPWHDVHSSISGPSASALSKNFVDRWNGIASRYEKSHAAVQHDVKAIFDALGLRAIARAKLPRLPSPLSQLQQSKPGKNWVQVLRSAPKQMLDDESRASQSLGEGSRARHEQNNCLKAMLTNIHGAQKFIYIEGQFFQSAYGSDFPSKQSGLSGPMAALLRITSLPGYEKYSKRLGIDGASPAEVPRRLRWSQIDDVRREASGEGAAFLADLDAVLKNLTSIKASELMGAQQSSIHNPIGDALACRIEKAINDGKPFHVYLVLPVHPEGTLNTLNIMSQLHITMQSLVFGSHSLINRVRRAIQITRLRKIRKISKAEAAAIVDNYTQNELEESTGDSWQDYLTLLNLRNWQILDKRPVTEQIYVHSKLLIVDDRVAVLGSANINDRSLLGNRDSELAVTVRDDESITVKLDGLHDDLVSASVHQLRVRLWKKLFGLMGSSDPARELAEVILKPADRATWKAIQAVGHANALAYQSAFPFLPRIQGKPSSIWPTWDQNKRALTSHMPFSERFWRGDSVMDEHHSWEANQRKGERAPVGIRGFIVALPISWTAGENNSSGMNLTLLANNDVPTKENAQIANAIHDRRNDKIGFS